MNDKTIPAMRETKRGKHPNSQEALKPTQYKKGETGNAGGRPQLKEFAKKLSKYGNEKIIMDSLDADLWNNGVTDLGTNKEIVISKIWELARAWDKDMIKLLVNLDCLV